MLALDLQTGQCELDEENFYIYVSTTLFINSTHYKNWEILNDKRKDKEVPMPSFKDQYITLV